MAEIKRRTFRLPDEVMTEIDRIARRQHKGNRTAAIIAAVQSMARQMFRGNRQRAGGESPATASSPGQQ